MFRRGTDAVTVPGSALHHRLGRYIRTCPCQAQPIVSQSTGSAPAQRLRGQVPEQTDVETRMLVKARSLQAGRFLWLQANACKAAQSLPWLPQGSSEG